jgi:hypothetical protein
MLIVMAKDAFFDGVILPNEDIYPGFRLCAAVYGGLVH